MATNAAFFKSLKRPDRFLKVLTDFFQSMAAHARQWLIGVAAILLVGGSYALWSGQRAERQSAAREALYSAEKIMEGEWKALLPPAEKSSTPEKGAKKDAKTAAPVSPTTPTPEERLRASAFSVSEKMPQTVVALNKVANDYAGTVAGTDALLTLGDLVARHESPEAAVSYYEKAASQAPDSMTKALARSAMGYAYERAGKWAEAQRAFEQALQLGQAPLHADLLLATARVQVAQNLKDAAKATYDRIIKDLPATEAAQIAERQKAAL